MNPAKVSLYTQAFHFIGTKPTAVVFGDENTGGERVLVKSWRSVFVTILRHAIKDPIYHNQLMELRNMVLGRRRIIVSDKPDGMTRPFEICEGLYCEVHYGTRTLMEILRLRILDAIGYRYGDIRIEIAEL